MRPSVLTCITLSLVTTLLPGPAEACTNSNGNHPNHDYVSIVIDSLASGLASAIQAGYTQWNSTACVDAITPYPYPRFGPSGTGTVTVKLVDGTSPSDLGDGCASWIGNSNVATVFLYTQVRSSSGDIYDCDFSNQEKVSDLVAHELGHFLGLAESGCTNAIMGPQSVLYNGNTAWDVTTSRSILLSECSMADYNSTTTWESEELACYENPACDPYSPSGPLNCPILIDLDKNDFHLAGDPVYFDLRADEEPVLTSGRIPASSTRSSALTGTRTV